MDLRKKLKQLDTLTGRPAGAKSVRDGVDVDTVSQGKEISLSSGTCYRMKRIYPDTFRHGKIALNGLREIDPGIFSLVGKDDSLQAFSLQNTVFIDTETTGLAGGTGTVPFLVGLGKFCEDGFQVEQFFMRDFHEERALLEAVHERLARAGSLVSYNGKAFDMNLLASRFTLARMDNPATDLPHLDLLHVSRRLWHRRLSDCSLGNIEASVLGFHREEDIPGDMIPRQYFEYLRSRHGSLVKPIFVHNRWDVIALAALAGVCGSIYQSPDTEISDGLDYLSLGRAMEDLRPEHASACYRRALSCPLEDNARRTALNHLGFTLKRMRRYDDAEAVWLTLIEVAPESIRPYEELAKVYEHRLGRLAEAEEIVRRAINRIDIAKQMHSRDAEAVRQDLVHRLVRIRRKISREGG